MNENSGEAASPSDPGSPIANETGKTTSKGRRDTAMDGLRAIAVLLMMASHTSRLIAWDARREWCRFSLLIEPLTASLFLILVGASLRRSWMSARARGRWTWIRKQGLRALALWVTSCLFYTLEEGFHPPDALVLSGILATIGYTIFILSPLVSLRKPVPVLGLFVAVLLGTHFLLDHAGLRWFMINAGNSPLLPLLPFAALGALGVCALESRRKWMHLLLATVAAGTLLSLTLKFGFAEIFNYPLGRYDTVRAIVSGTGALRVEKTIPYYNLRPLLVPMIASIIVLVYGLLSLLRPWLDGAARFLLPLGRHSLDAYIVHLSILALFVLKGGKRPLVQTWQGDSVFIFVIFVTYLWTLWRDTHPLRWKRAQASRK